MKVMVFVKATPETETGVMETDQDRAAMDKYNDDLVEAGIRLAVGGLRPRSEGASLHFNGQTVRVMDRQVIEAKDRVVGFWIWQVRSMEEAIEWAKRCPLPSGDVGVLELRPFNGPDDFTSQSLSQ